jgi:hypothetical protein
MVAKKPARVRRPLSRDDVLPSTGAPTPTRRPPMFDRPLQAADVTELQQTAGNRAAIAAVQRNALIVQRAGPVPWSVKATRQNRPTHGADVRAVLRTELPGLLGGMSGEQLNHWQRVVDYYAINRHLGREIVALEKHWEYRAGPLYESSGGYQSDRRRLDAARPTMPEGGTKITVDPSNLLADDVRAEPEWDVKAEKAFRQWAVAQLTKDPPVFDIYPIHDDEIVTRRTWVGSYTTKGLITLQDLQSRFGAQYQSMVSNRDDWQRLRQALADTSRSFDEAVQTHKERSQINKENEGWFGIDIVRNLIEAVGEGDEDYPAMAQWDEPKALIARARSLMEQGQFEALVPILAMAELSTAKAAQRIYAYDNRVESGARFWVKWLGRVKTVGSVAASIAAGPLGVTGSALVAGGYTLVQEGSQNAMAYALGQRTDLGLTSLVKQAGIATVAGMLGGALQTRFQAAMAARMAAITGTAGGAARDATLSAAAAMTSSAYNTAAEAVLNSIVLGQAFPKSATEFADLIVDKALQAGAMDVALRGPSARVAREYQAWRAGKTAPVVPTATGKTGTADPNAAPTKAAATPPARDMPEYVARRLLAHSESWRRLQNELQTGTGLGQGMVPAERQALLDRFNATREQLARDVAGMFEGTVVAADTPIGRQIEVRFHGDKGTEHSTHAMRYLDTKSPGWQRQTDVALYAGGPELGARGTRAMRALEQITPEGRLMAARFAPLYETWHTRSPIDKVRALVQVINDYNRPFGVPDIYPLIGRSDNAGQFQWRHWQLEIHPGMLLKRDQTPAEFARLVDTVVHEGRHALDAFRAIRADPQRARGRVAAEVMEAALAADLKTRPAEPMTPGSLAHTEGLRFSESVWGGGAQRRREVYDSLDAASGALTRAIREVRRNAMQPRFSAQRNEAARFYWAAKASRERAHDEYMRLPEEVEPWRAGREAQAAVRERLALEREIRTLRDQVEQTHRRLVQTEDDFVEAAINATTTLAGAERAFDRARELYARTIAQLQRLRQRHAALTAPVPTAP